MDDITTKATRCNSPYRKDIALSRKTPQGIAIETGIVDVNVNPEYISKRILVEMKESVVDEVVQTTLKGGGHAKE